MKSSLIHLTPSIPTTSKISTPTPTPKWNGSETTGKAANTPSQSKNSANQQHGSQSKNSPRHPPRSPKRQQRDPAQPQVAPGRFFSVKRKKYLVRDMLWRFICSACYTIPTIAMNADDRRIPWKETESDESELRRNQKISSLPNSAKNELRGLTELTQRQCQSIPNLVDYYQTQQSDEMCVPGGYILFIAMSYCPGRPVGGDKFRGLGVGGWGEGGDSRGV